MIFEKLQDIIADQLDIDKEKITLDSDINKDIGADSLDIVEMLMSVEKEWNIIVDDSDAGDIHTIKDVVEFIERKVKK